MGTKTRNKVWIKKIKFGENEKNINFYAIFERKNVWREAFVP